MHKLFVFHLRLLPSASRGLSITFFILFLLLLFGICNRHLRSKWSVCIITLVMVRSILVSDSFFLGSCFMISKVYELMEYLLVADIAACI